ncbi:MAG: LysR family transcriptional regulator [Myxococcales bacterium]|nr:LysR family transcriptional regulator [Myxococcales bacterium]
MRSRGRKTDRPFDWDDLRTALFLAREQSVRRAARALSVSHSTVLRRIAALEARAGVRLFDKLAEGYVMTAAGEEMFAAAKDLEEIVTGLERRVRGRDTQLSGAVRVTLPDPFLPLMVPILRAFGDEYPEIEVTISVGVGYADLAHREADLAIRTTPEPPPDLIGRRVAEAGVGIYGAASYLRGRKTRDLEALDWVGWEHGSEMAFARWMEKNVPNARVPIRVTHSWAIGAAVDAGAGVAIYPCAYGELRPGWKRVRLMEQVSAPMWLLSHRDLKTTARVRVLRDYLAVAIGKQRKVVEGR